MHVYLGIVLGCLVLYSPVFSALSLTTFVGVVLIVYSVINIVYMIVIRKNAKDVEKLIAEKTNIVDYNTEAEETKE